MMLVVSKPYYDNILLVFIAGCIGATALELVTGVVMEALFKVRYWEYFHKKFNFKGYICLESSLVWGVCTVIFTHFLQVPVERLILMIPYNILSVVTVTITVVMCFDFALAFKTALDIRDVLVYMEKAKAEMQRMQKRLDAIIAFKGEEVRESLEAKVEGLSNTAQGITSRAYAIGSGVGSGIGAIGTGISNRLDAISAGLEKSFGVLKEKMKLDPASYVGNAREEVLELYAKYRVMMARVTPHPIKNFYEWYTEHAINGSPTMTSPDYQASFEEVKEMTRKAKRMTTKGEEK